MTKPVEKIFAMDLVHVTNYLVVTCGSYICVYYNTPNLYNNFILLIRSMTIVNHIRRVSRDFAFANAQIVYLFP